MLLFSKYSYAGYKKYIKKTGQGLVTPLVNTHSHTSNTCKHVHTNTRTYANNKELHRHRVTLEALTNKHICAQAHTPAQVCFHINSVSLSQQ